MLTEIKERITRGFFEWFWLVVMIVLAVFIIGGAQAKAQPFDANGNSVVIGGPPSGCPFRAFCGCALAKRLGINDRRLWLAWNWARLFPRTHAHAGAVAVRHHHVMLLESQVSAGHWQVFDPNSGGHLTRRHVRDVTGYVFVDPSARGVASNE